MKTCCFCWGVVGGDSVAITEGWFPVNDTDMVRRFTFPESMLNKAEYAHVECFERAKAVFAARVVAVASRGGAA